MAGLLLERPACQAAATDIGPATAQVVAHLLADPAVDRLRPIISLLRLRETYGDTRLEAACARAVRFDQYRYSLIKRILEQGRDQTPLLPVSAPPGTAQTFVRSAAELLGHLFGGGPWS